MFDIIHKHYNQTDSKSETRIIKSVIIEKKIPHDPICQRCERRFSYHGQKDDKCVGFVSTGTLLIPDKLQSESKVSS